MSFESLGLSPALLRALSEKGYQQPTEIQRSAIPAILQGRDMLAGAQTGTGKTAAFALPILERLYPDGQPGSKNRFRALILAPTRELVAQVHESFQTYGRLLKVQAAAIYGGVSMVPQIKTLKKGVDVVIATPGRLIDHLERGTFKMSNLEILVLDEADRMLDMGFLPALKTILQYLPAQRQSLMFSATFTDPIKILAAQFLKNPMELQSAQRNSAANTVTHVVHPVEANRKKELLLHLLSQDSRRQTLVFGRTKHGADRLCDYLQEYGFRSVAIHGGKTQAARTKALRDFKQGKATIMVATDVASRGLDIQQLPVVINLDLPMVAEDYIHRIGRTGRAGMEGHAISLVAPTEKGLLRDIQRLLKCELAVQKIPGFEADLSLGGGDFGKHKRPQPGNSFKPGQGRRGRSGENNAFAAKKAASRRDGKASGPGGGFSQSKAKSGSSNRGNGFSGAGKKNSGKRFA